MPSSEKIVKILFNAEDKTGKAFDSVSSGLESINSRLESVTAPLTNVAETVLALEASMLGLGAAFTGLAINEAGKFQDAVNEINTLLEISPDKFEQFSREILEFSRSSTQSIETINASVYSAISAGLDYEQSLRALSEAERLAVAGKSDLQSTIVLIASTLNSYGLSVDQAGRVSDIFFETVRQGQTTLPELASSLSNITGLASSAGIPLETLAAAIADLTAKGLPTSQAITGIKAALSNIIKPSKTAADTARELGIEFNAGALRAKGLEGVLLDVANATGGNTETMSALFGSVEGLNSALLLTRDSGAGFVSTLEDMQNSSGAVEKAYSKMSENLQLINQNLSNNITATLVTVGSRLLDDYGELARALGRVFEGVSIGVDAGAFDPVFAQLEVFAGQATEFLETLAVNLPAALGQIRWEGFLESLQGLGDAVFSLFDGVDVSTPEALADAIQNVVDTAGTLTDATAGIVQGLGPFFDRVVELVQWINSFDAETVKLAGTVGGLSLAFATIVPSLAVIGVGLKSAVAGISALSSTSAASGIAALTGSISGLTAALGKGGLVAAAGGAGFAVGSVAKEIIDDVIPGIDSLGTKLFELVAPAEAAGAALESSIGPAELLELAYSDVTAKTRDLAEATEQAAEKNYDLTDSESELNALMAQVNEGLTRQNAALRLTADGVAQTVLSIDSATDSVNEYTRVSGELVQVVRDAEGKIIEYRDAHKGIKATIDETTESTEKAISETEKYRLKLEELASNERIKQIEAKLTLDVAELEAQTKIVEKSFDSIDKTIESTGDLLGSLFSTLSEAGRFEQLLIEDQIEQENRRREEALKKQNELIDAQVAYLREKGNALARGDAQIKVDGDGLQPHLEAFMWEILDAIQVRANADGTEFLLNVA